MGCGERCEVCDVMCEMCVFFFDLVGKEAIDLTFQTVSPIKYAALE